MALWMLGRDGSRPCFSDKNFRLYGLRRGLLPGLPLYWKLPNEAGSGAIAR